MAQSKSGTNNIHKNIPEKWDEAVHVIVVGSGYAGLAAAAESAGLSGKVLILEKMNRYGGNSIISGGGYSSYDSMYHMREKFALGEDSWQQHMEDTLRGGDYYGVPELVEVLAKSAPDGLNWLIEAGAKLLEILPRIGGHSAHRSHLAKGGGGGLIKPLKSLALQRGAKLYCSTRVTRIWRKDENGPVLGVETTDGRSSRNIRAERALILAAGGFGSDIPMRLSVNPKLVPEYGLTNHNDATGEIIRYARAVWADILHLEFIQLYPCANPKNGAIDPYALHAYTGTSFGLFYVNASGERFVNELERRDVVSDAQIKSQCKPSYAILDQDIFRRIGISDKQIKKGVDIGRIIAAASISELADKLKMDTTALENSIGKHNSYIQNGNDRDFNKPILKSMVCLDSKPLYAIPQWPAIHYCMGGLRIDKDARVIDIWGRPIPGLFAAGEICGGIHGTNRLAGNAIADCIVFGRIAGINAAKC